MQSKRDQYVFKATLGYVLFSTAWVFLSDQMLRAFGNIPSIIWMSSVKGGAFIVLTAAYFYLSLRGAPSHQAGFGHTGLDFVSQDQTGTARSRLSFYGFAVLSSFAVIALHQSMSESLQDRPFLIVYMLPIIVSALLGGFGPGILATGLTCLSAAYWAIPPFGSFFIENSQDGFQLSLLFLNGVIASYVSHTLRRSRDEARRGLALLDAVVSNSPDAIYVKDKQGRYMLVNTAMARGVGRPISDLIGKNAEELFPFAMANEVLETDQKVLQSATPVSYEQVLKFATGDVFTCLVTKGRLLDSNGNPFGVFGIARNITEAKAIEAEREQHRIGLEAQVVSRTQELLNLYDQAPCGYHSLSPDGVILRVNKTELALLGYSEDEYLGHRFEQFLTKESSRLFRENFPRFLKTGKLRNIEYDFVCKNGSIRSFLLDGDLTRDASGKAMFTHETLVDNTDRKAHDAQINAMNSFLQEVVESLPFGVVVLDENQRVVLKNKLFNSLLDYPEDAIVPGASTFTDILRLNHKRGDYHGSPLAKVFARYLQAMRARQTVNFERQQANGVHLSICGLPLNNGWTLLTYTNISAHKQAEKKLNDALSAADAANNAKSRFLAAASHDLRQPLTALNMYTGALGKATSPTERKLAANMQACVDSMSDLLTDLLDLSKLDAGVVIPNENDFPVAGLFARLGSAYEPKAQAKGIGLRIRPSTFVTRTDHVLLLRIVSNLVENAIRYTERGAVLIACRRRQAKHWIEVWDTGIGIPSESQTEIFEAFRQLGDGARNTGSGLGLAIVARTAALLGLKVTVRSRQGRGSVFAIELPQGTLVRTEPTTPEPPAFRPLRIALVEDNNMVREALVLALQTLGHQVLDVVDKNGLLAELKQFQPHVVMTDYRLAHGENGLDVVEAVKSRLGAKFPMILVTGDTDPALLRDMADHGVVIFHKPLNLNALQACFQELTTEESEWLGGPRNQAAGVTDD